jgi:hypothetical protein
VTDSIVLVVIAILVALDLLLAWREAEANRSARALESIDRGEQTRMLEDIRFAVQHQDLRKL